MPVPVTTRTVNRGGRNGAELFDDLSRAGIRLNESAIELLQSAAFTTSDVRTALVTVEFTVNGLGFPYGATFPEIIRNAIDLDLSLCPIDVGPHFRLQYLDQPEGFLGQPITQHRAPPGSITIASEPHVEDGDFPRGFYLRRIEGALWLRGYQSDGLHCWAPDDHLLQRTLAVQVLCYSNVSVRIRR